MNEDAIYAARLLKLALLDADGETIGRVDDLVLGPPFGDTAPVLLGLVGRLGRRRIFVAATRVRRIDSSGVELGTSALDFRPFAPRPGELLLTSLLDRPVGSDRVVDVALGHGSTPSGPYEVARVLLGRRGRLRRAGPGRTVPWRDVADLFETGSADAEVARLRSRHPAETARALQRLSVRQRDTVAAALHEHELADVLEELPETDQAAIVGGLDIDRAARVLAEMEPDDATDLLGQLSSSVRRQLLEAMDPDEASPLRLLLRYDADTAGGLMTSEPIILAPEAPVAEALARLRVVELAPAVAACVFVVQPPMQPPTGAYLGAPSFQALLNERPSARVGDVADGEPAPIPPSLPALDVAIRLAAYNLLSVPVCDDEGRLLGAVTVDDVLDRTLPSGWRSAR